MGQIRPFVEDDIPQVADMYARLLLVGSDALGDGDFSPALWAYFQEMFFRHPWYDEAFPSLVYQEDGRVRGFLGVLPRELLLKGQPIQAAVTCHFMVEPVARATLAGVQLLRTFFRGSQDLSFADSAGEVGRKVWEGVGGTTALLYSLHWIRPLRPLQCMLSALAKEGSPGAIGRILRPLFAIGDRLASRMPRSPFLLKPQDQEEELTAETLLECLAEFSRQYALRPKYDIPTLRWLLETLARKTAYGSLRKVLVRGAGGEVLGWYLYYSKPDGISEVLQIGSRHHTVGAVLDHLFCDAWRHGAIAVSGRAEPKFMAAFTAKLCLFRRAGPWMLVHSNNPELLQTILRGDAFLTRLEGEWWIPFQSDRQA